MTISKFLISKLSSVISPFVSLGKFPLDPLLKDGRRSLSPARGASRPMDDFLVANITVAYANVVPMAPYHPDGHLLFGKTRTTIPCGIDDQSPLPKEKLPITTNLYIMIQQQWHKKKKEDKQKHSHSLTLSLQIGSRKWGDN